MEKTWLLKPCLNLGYLLHWKLFKNDKLCFLFHLKSCFNFQNIFRILLRHFGHIEKTA